MFTKKHQPEQPKPSKTPTLIGANTNFKGRFSGSDDICIEGQFTGEIHSEGSVYVNKSAVIQADIRASYVYVHGCVQGNVVAREQLNIGENGRVDGDVQTKALTVLTGGHLEGSCRMYDEPNPTGGDEPMTSTSAWDLATAVPPEAKEPEEYPEDDPEKDIKGFSAV